MKKILHWLIPREREFFEMLARQSENSVEAVKELKKFAEDYHKFERNERKSKALSIKYIEGKADDATRIMMAKLNKSFRASIDKEELRRIVVLLEDIIDLINSVSSKLVILNIGRIDSYIIKLVDVAVDSVGEVNKSMADLSKLKDAEGRLEKIKNLEKKADSIYEEALSELFHFYKNSIDIMKYREIYELLERSVDKCHDVADVMQDIISKRA